MVEVAKRAIPDADVLLFMVDVSRPPSRADREVAKLLSPQQDMPVVLTMNKVDLVGEREREQHTAAYQALGRFDESLCISALMGYNRGELL